LQLTPAASIEIRDSKGKFDFLRIDSKRGRLLAAHENDGTSDFIDLRKNTLITRVKVGGPVDTAVDNDSKFYYVSVQEPQRIAVLDAETLKEVKSIQDSGPHGRDHLRAEESHGLRHPRQRRGCVGHRSGQREAGGVPSRYPGCRSSSCTTRKRTESI